MDYWRRCEKVRQFDKFRDDEVNRSIVVSESSLRRIEKKKEDTAVRIRSHPANGLGVGTGIGSSP